MTPEFYRRASDLFANVRDLPEPERSTAIASVCGDDAELRSCVLQLMQAEQIADRQDFLQARAVEDAAGFLMAPLPVPGAIIGNFRLAEQIGAGGMGVIFKAEDLRLHRSVALKILPQNAISGSDRIQRFEREALAVSRLNHPNIVSVFDANFERGQPYIAMEFVSGRTLRDLIASGPVDEKTLLDVLIQTASALSAAHEAGIVHRDIKPENIMIRNDGIVKVLDFGLARLFLAEPGEAAQFQTRPGIVTGTIQYLSPEQVAGGNVGPESDLFSLGVVAYELVTGRRPFESPTDAGVLQGILHQTPNAPSSVRQSISTDLDALILRLIEKDSELRFQTAADLRSVCKRLKRDSSGLMRVSELIIKDAAQGKAAPSAGNQRGVFRRTWAKALVLAVAAFAIGAALVYSYSGERTTSPEMRLDIVTPPMTEPTSIALSPDGRKIVCSAVTDGSARLWVRRLDSTVGRAIAGTEGGLFPFWSPDSREIGFAAEGKLKRVSLEGGTPKVLADAPQFRGASWNTDDVIVFTPNSGSGLFRISSSGGTATPVFPLASGAESQRSPRFLPDGRHFLFYTLGKEPGIYLGSLDAKEGSGGPVRVTAADTAGEYLPSGWLLWVQQSVLLARRFNVASGTLSGDAIPVAQPVASGYAIAPALSVSRTGLIAWCASTSPRRQLVWFTRFGASTGVLGEPDEFNALYPEISPNGRRVAVTRGIGGPGGDIWLVDAVRQIRFTYDPADDRFPIWSPDGARVAFSSNRRGVYDLYARQADGSAPEELLLSSPEIKIPNSWSPDKRFILYYSAHNSGDLMVLPLEGDRTPYAFLSTPFSEMNGAFSPDGKWVAYQSNESGRNEVYVRKFAAAGAVSQISTAGGEAPRWRADGRELYYLAPGSRIMGVAVAEQGGALTGGQPVPLITATNLVTSVTSFGRPQYDVARDGRFLLEVDLTDSSRNPITLLANWNLQSRDSKRLFSVPRDFQR